jgi:mediator of RNA polymerase II transcription subunit 21
MSDRLTQLQDCLDQLLTQMFATITYIDTHHSPIKIAGQSDQWGDAAPENTQQESAQQMHSDQQEPKLGTTKEPIADPPALFQSRLKELAQDLVLKEQQVEALAESLPGIGSSQEAQERRLEDLEKELKEVEREEVAWEDERKKLMERMDGWVKNSRIRRV